MLQSLLVHALTQPKFKLTVTLPRVLSHNKLRRSSPWAALHLTEEDEFLTEGNGLLYSLLSS